MAVRLIWWVVGMASTRLAASAVIAGWTEHSATLREGRDSPVLDGGGGALATPLARRAAMVAMARTVAPLERAAVPLAANAIEPV